MLNHIPDQLKESLFYSGFVISLSWTAYMIYSDKFTFLDYFLDSMIISLIPIGAIAIMSPQLSSQKSPNWYKKIRKTIPEPLFFFVTLFIATVSAGAFFPIIHIPFGLLISFICHIFLHKSWKFSDQPSWWKRSTKIFYAIFVFIAFTMMITPALIRIATGR